MEAMIDLVQNFIIMVYPKMDLLELELVLQVSLTFKQAEKLEVAKELLLAEARKLAKVLVQPMVFIKFHISYRGPLSCLIQYEPAHAEQSYSK